MAKNLLETTLVMVKALLAFVVHAADIDDNRAGIEDGRVSGTLQVCVRSAIEYKTT